MASANFRRGYQCLVIITLTAIASETREDATDAINGTSELNGTSSAESENGTNGTHDSDIGERHISIHKIGKYGVQAWLYVRYPQEFSDIFIGGVVRMEFFANFQHYTHIGFSEKELLTIMLIASDDSTLVLSRIVNIRVGTNLRFSDPDWKDKPVKHRAPGFKDIKLGVAFDKSVDFYLGSVTDSQLSSTLEASMLSIYYELVCVGLGSVEVGETVPSHVLVKGTDILVLSVDFVYKGTKSVDSKPSFHLVNSTDQIELFKPLTIEMTMVNPYPTSYVDVTVAASPLHQGSMYGTLSEDQYQGLLVQSIQGRSVGTAFNYSVFPEHLTASGYDTCPLKSTLSLVTGPFVNRESLLESPDHESSSYISIDVTLLLTDPTMAAPAVSVVFGMHIGNMILVQNITVAVSQQNDDTGESSPNSDSVEDFLISETPNTVNISSGQTSHVYFLLRTLQTSNHTYVLKVNTTLGNFTEVNPYDNALKLLSVKPEFFGSNLECQPVKTRIEKLHGEQNQWAYELKVTVFNTGIYNDSDSDLLGLNATMIVLGSAKEGEVFRMTTRLNERPISKTFIVDGPPKIRFGFGLVFTVDTDLGGYPFFARFVIHTPPGSRMTYNVTINVRAYGDQKPELLTVNFIKSGSNLHEGFQISDLAVQLSNSLNSDVLDTGTMTFFVKNSGENVDDGANDLTLDIVVMRSKVPSTGRLRVDVNKIGYRRTVFRSLMFIGYKESILNATIGSTCPTRNFYAGQVNVFEVHVQTIRHSIGGKLQILIRASQGFTFENASVISKGNNVACVNVGPLEATTLIDGQSYGTVMLNIPLLCNTERTDSKAEDKLVIGVTVRMSPRLTDATFSAELSTSFTSTNISQAFTIVPVTDMGSLINVGNLKLADTTYEDMDAQTVNPRLHWSVDGKAFYTTELKKRSWSAYRNEMTMYPEQTPLLARFFGATLGSQDACSRHLKINTDHDVPLLHGWVNKTGPVLYELASVINYRDVSCMRLAGPGSIVDLPYLWAEFNTSMFGLGESRPFTVYLAGYGLHCGERKGSQVIMVVFPKQNHNFNGENHQRLCEYIETDASVGYQGCRFVCDCSGAEECDRFTLLIMNTGTLEKTSKLCTMDVLPYY